MMSKLYNFNTDFAWSESFGDEDVTLLKWIFPPRTVVRKSDATLDKLGADFFGVTVNFDENRNPRGEAVYFVDIKRRRSGAAKFWQYRAGVLVPELALELGDGGGLFKSPVITDGLVYVFDPSDYPFAIAVDFRELQQAARLYRKIWQRQYRTITQHNQRGGSYYEVVATFVPVDIIQAAGVSVAKILLPQERT